MGDAWRNRIVGHGDSDPALLVSHPSNWRAHPREQRNALRTVIGEVGWVQDVIVNRRTGRLVDGHLRVALAIEKGEPTVPTVFVDLTEREEALVLASLDPIGAMAETQRAKLEDLLGSLRTDDVDVSALLASVAQANGVDPLEQLDGTLPGSELDDAPAPPANPTTKPGDLIALGDHRLLCGDATKPEDLARLMGGEKADAVFTDPPYNVAYEGGTAEALTIANDDMDPEAFRAFLLAFYRAALSCVRPGAAIYVCHADTWGEQFRGAMCEAGWLLKQCLVWVKGSFVLGRQDYHWQHEPILYGWAPGGAHSWHGDRAQGTVLRHDKPVRCGVHPTMKPVNLITLCLQNSTAPGELVLDPFGGSGSTLIAAEKLGRRARLTELDPRYCDVIAHRWEAATGRKAEAVAE